MSKLSINELGRPELLELQGEIKKKLKTFRPYRIKERVIQCGKKTCWCIEGPDGHGPYLHVTYREDGKTRSVGLGPKLLEWEMVEARPAMPELFDYFTVPDYKYMRMARADTIGWLYRTLSDEEFKSRYGVSKVEDALGRASKFWCSGDDYERYEQDRLIVLEEQGIPYNPWVGWGVSTLRGMAVLGELEARGYYLKT